MEPIGFESHDHARCIHDHLAVADAYCAEHKLQFTPVRRRVLELLLHDHRALGAYDILELLRAEGRSAQPPVAYRALDFLVQHGLAHKIERLNAFTACMHPGQDHTPAFLICRDCDAVAEAQAEPANDTLGKAAREAAFIIDETTVEALGQCPRCRETLEA